MIGKPDIVSVWGNADKFNLTYDKGTDGLWRASVPPDMTDGQYACEIHALDAAGFEGYWTGILYMRQGSACIHLSKPHYSFWLLRDRKMLSLRDEKIVIKLKEVCCHGIKKY